MFKNNKVKSTGINYSRYIASWRSMGGYIYRPMKGNWKEGSFQDWLHSEGLTDDEIYECTELATCGKSELNDSAKRFMRSHGYINI